MFRMIRRGIVTALAMAVLLVPVARAQTDADKKQLFSAFERAETFRKQGKLAEAVRNYEQALDLAPRAFGPEHKNTSVIMNNLAALYSAMGRYGDAEPLNRRSLEIREKQLGRDHPDVANSLNGLAILVAALGRWDEADDAVDRERRVVRRHVARELPALSEAEQLAFLKANDEKQLHVALSVALARCEVAKAVERSAGWVLNGKATAHEALAQRALLARDRGNSAAAPIVVQLTSVRHQVAALTLANPRPGREKEQLQEIERLSTQERELSRQLGQAAGRPARDDPWVAPDEVRRALPTDAVLVKIARFRVVNFRAKGSETQFGPPHYAAWVIPPAGQGAVTLVDLGEAEAIEAAVAAVRNGIQPAAAALRDRGEPELEAELRKPLEALAERVLRPLLPHIGAAKRWVLSPDAALWLVPWAALPLDKDRYAIEDLTIRYVVSGRDLAQASGKSPERQGQALVMADPDYDLDPTAVRQATRLVLRGSTAAADELALRGLSRSFSLGSIKRLPGTATEAKAIEPKLQAYARSKPIVYTDRFALEAVFKVFRQPRVVLLSTHGFFLEDQKEEAGDRAGLLLEGRETGRKPRVTSENPLLRCGLLLAGCNHPQGDEDGVLTGLEIVGTDLRGTELDVLSACETGVGEVRNGEGVAGLRQAFQLAGVETVVATLWQVPDKESARLMAGFFDNLAAGQGKADALRSAQLDLIKSRRERFGAAHPFFWAAFTVTGPK